MMPFPDILDIYRLNHVSPHNDSRLVFPSLRQVSVNLLVNNNENTQEKRRTRTHVTNNERGDQRAVD
jgi:hypothetical protein